jgi:hypothetical protein
MLLPRRILKRGAGAVFLFIAFASSVCFASPKFVGVLTSNGVTYIAVRDDSSANAIWVGIGQSVGEYRIVSYDPKKEILSVVRDSAALEVPLMTASVQPAPVLALIERLVENGDTELASALDSLRTLDERRKKTAAELSELETRAVSDPAANERLPRRAGDFGSRTAPRTFSFRHCLSQHA